VDECRIPTDKLKSATHIETNSREIYGKFAGGEYHYDGTKGRWPANVCHSGDDEVMEAFAAFGKSVSHNGSEIVVRQGYYGLHGSAFAEKPGRVCQRIVDEGSPARFFYQAKATKADRAGSKHPTVKPIALMRWLVRLVTPPGGTVLDPFAGSGTTGAAALAEGRRVILIEQQPEYIADIKRRLKTLQQIAKAAA
jgi:site-specific DNA-methyltransferase (adenine-specific)